MQQLLTLQRASHSSGVALVALVIANAVPLAGVLLLDWSLPAIMALYWAENGVVGVFALLRILTAAGPAPAGPPPRPGSRVTPMSDAGIRYMLAPFFTVHYGMFWLGHGFFVLLVFPGMLAGVSDAWSPDLVFDTVPALLGTVLAALPFLFVSHGLSYWLNWLQGGERLTSHPSQEMFAPYGRVVVLHLTIILGAFAVAAMGTPVWALVVMVLVKTGLDVSAHLAERRRAAGRAVAGGISMPVRVITRTLR